MDLATAPMGLGRNQMFAVGVDLEMHRRVGARRNRRQQDEAHDGARVAGAEGDDAFDAMGDFYCQAYKLISSPAARKAFSLDDEPEAMTKLYGEYKRPNGQPFSIGRQLMLARRLVESGVRFFASPTCHHVPEVYSAVGETESAALLKEFFKVRR